MAKIVIATPGGDMHAQATEVVQGAGIDARVIQVSSQTVLAALEAERERGAAVVVARGNHAHLIKTHTDMPLIEIVLSGQELALLIEQAIALAGKPSPVVALVGFRHMFSDPEPFARILGADVRICYAPSTEQLPETVEQAQHQGADVIVGGEIAIAHAQAIGMKSVFLGSSKSSLVTAISIATRVLYGIEREQQKAAEFMSLLNYSFDVILKLDRQGCVQVANYMAEKALHRPASELRGMSLFDLLEIGPGSPLEEAMKTHSNAYSIVVRTSGEAYVANLATILVEGALEGFILSMQAFGRIDELEETVRADRYNRGYTAKATFDQLHTQAQPMRQLCEDAMQYAQYDLPVLITGVFGTDKAGMAQCIHNASTRRKGPFVAISLAGLTPEMQLLKFAGERGGQEVKSVFELAHTGTLFIDQVDLMDARSQLQLLNVLSEGFLLRKDGRPLLPVNVRVLCAASCDLYALVQQGKFLEPLYCRIAQLDLRIPTLRERAEDIPGLIEKNLALCAEKYRKFIKITPEAQALLHAQAWEGDVLQLAMFIEKLTILARDKEIGEAFVRKHLPQGQREAAKQALPPIPPVFYSREEAAVTEALRAHGGNRQAAAQALGISKTTLWRKMKKHGISPAFAKEEVSL